MSKNNRKPKTNLCSPVRDTAYYALMAYALIVAGCAEPRQYEAVDQICPVGLNKQQAMRIAEDVLAKMNFTIAKSDANLGVIRTRPLPGAQFFEFWRKDNVGVFNSAEANLHTIRRIAGCSLQQQGTQLCIRCNVNTQRLHLPEREIRSRARAYEMFSQSGPTRQTFNLYQNQKQDMVWVDLGNDTKLATVILKRIENKITGTQKGKNL